MKNSRKIKLMIKVDAQAWQVMVAHAEAKFPNECCGAMIGNDRRRREACHLRRADGERLCRCTGRSL